MAEWSLWQEGGWEREKEKSILDDNAVVEVVVNTINNRVDDNDDVLICKQGQSQSSPPVASSQGGQYFVWDLKPWETDNVGWSISVQTFPLRLEVQLIVDKAVTAQSMKKNSTLVWGSEKKSLKKVPYVTVAVLCKSKADTSRRGHQDVRGFTRC